MTELETTSLQYLLAGAEHSAAVARLILPRLPPAQCEAFLHTLPEYHACVYEQIELHGDATFE